MGNRLSPDIRKETLSGTTGSGISYATSAMRGRRPTMEDCHAIFDIPGLPDHSVFCVFDGHGGAYIAKHAADGLQEALLQQTAFQSYQELYQGGSGGSIGEEKSAAAADSAKLLELLTQALQQAFVDLDRQLYEHFRSKPRLARLRTSSTTTAVIRRDAGSTACLILLTPQHILCANAGDSRAVLTRSNGKVIPLSYDHRANDPEEELRINQAGGVVHGGRIEDDLMVSRGFGDYRYKNTDAILNQDWTGVETAMVVPIPHVEIIVRNNQKQKDLFLLCACDGIYDVRSNTQVREDLHALYYYHEQRHPNNNKNTTDNDDDSTITPLLLERVCENLLDVCLRKGSTDNMTVILVKLSQDKPKLLREASVSHQAKSQRFHRHVNTINQKNLRASSTPMKDKKINPPPLRRNQTI